MTSEHSWRRLVVALLALVLAPLTVLATAGASHADPVVSISGTVTDTHGTPVEHVLVTAYQHDGSTWQPVGSAETAETTGSYEFLDLPAGSYRLGFCGCGYFPGYWTSTGLVDDIEDADDIVVPETGDPVVADAVLVEGGHIEGVITGGGDPLGAGRAVVYQRVGSEWEYAATGYTDGDGAYAVDTLEAGTYIVEFLDNEEVYLSEYFGGTPTEDGATEIELDLGETETASADLALGGTIVGTVTGEGSAHGVRVSISVADGPDDWRSVDLVTSSTGVYQSRGLPTGDYLVQFVDHTGDGYLSEYYDDSRTIAGATLVHVEQGQPTTADADLTLGGSITGTVTDGTDPLEFITVRAYQQDEYDDWQQVAVTQTSVDGGYVLAGLLAGQHRVEFSDEDAGEYVSEYFDDATAWDDADPVDVSLGVTTEDIDAVLSAGAAISGTVVDDVSDDPLDDVFVFAERLTAPDDWTYVGARITAGGGLFSLGGLPDGDYRLRFGAVGGTHLDEWWQDADNAADATIITLAPGEAYSLPAAARLTPAATISGTVSDGSGPVEDMQVNARAVVGDTTT